MLLTATTRALNYLPLCLIWLLDQLCNENYYTHLKSEGLKSKSSSDCPSLILRGKVERKIPDCLIPVSTLFLLLRNLDLMNCVSQTILFSICAFLLFWFCLWLLTLFACNLLQLITYPEWKQNIVMLAFRMAIAKSWCININIIRNTCPLQL